MATKAETTEAAPVALNLYQRLLAISDEAGALAKGGKADYGGNYAFHKIDDVEERLRPLFVKHGVMALPSLGDHQMTVAGKQTNVDAVVDVTFVNVDNPEERHTLRSLGQGLDTGDKGPGKAFSYALKTVYLAAFHMKGNPDNEADHVEREVPAASAKNGRAAAKPNGDTRTDDEMGRLAALAREADMPPAAVKALCERKFGTDPRHVTLDQLSELEAEIVFAGQAVSP